MEKTEVPTATTICNCPECHATLKMTVFYNGVGFGIELWCEGEDCTYNPVFFPEWDELIEEYGYGEREEETQ